MSTSEIGLFIPWVTLGLSFGLGLVLLRHLSITFRAVVRPFAAFVLGSIILTALSYFASLAIGFPTGGYAVQILAAFFLLIYCILVWQKKPELEPWDWFTDIRNDRIFLAILVISLIIFGALFSTHMLSPQIGAWHTGESTYGDLPFHLSTISQIAQNHTLPPENPFYAGRSLAYPFLVNVHSALLVGEGWSLRASLLIPGILFSISLVALVYDFVLTITKRRRIAALSTLLYFGNGGTGFYYFLRDTNFSFKEAWHALGVPERMREYSHVFADNIQWVNMTSRLIVPERSILLGIPAGIIILRLLFFRDTEKPWNWLDICLTAFLLALMPILHTHTVLVFAVALPLLALWRFRDHPVAPDVKRYLCILGITILFALPIIPLFTEHLGSTDGFFVPHLWWMTKAGESPITFWFKNSYLILPLALGVFIVPKVKTEVKILTGIGFLLFAIMNLWQFQPYLWDNVKFLIWGHLFWSIAIALVLGWAWQQKAWWPKPLVVVALITLLASASLSLWREVNYSVPLFSQSSQEVGEWAKANTPVDSVFLTYKVHNSPITNIAGRRILMGYPGMLWVHGINYAQTEKDVQTMYSGGVEAQKLLTDYNVSYAVLENYDPQGMRISRDFFNQYEQVYKNTQYTIYKTN